jgi:hypothetical protein
MENEKSRPGVGRDLLLYVVNGGLLEDFGYGAV